MFVQYDKTPYPLTKNDYRSISYKSGKIHLIYLVDSRNQRTGGVNLAVILPNDTNIYLGDFHNEKKAIRVGEKEIDTYWKVERETAKSMERVNRKGKQQ